MLRTTFLRVSRAASEAVLEEVHAAPVPAAVQEKTAAFLVAVWEEMRPVLKMGTAVLAVALSLQAVLRCGRLFDRAGTDVRRALMESWSRSPLYPMRALAQLFRVLTVMAYFDADEGLERYGYDVRDVRRMTALYNSTGYDA